METVSGWQVIPAVLNAFRVIQLMATEFLPVLVVTLLGLVERVPQLTPGRASLRTYLPTILLVASRTIASSTA